jgi:xanthine dehydrogenase accessory factor
VQKELDLWRFVADRLSRREPVVLLVVAESSGSSPGRAGYKMAVAADGELCGSIGGGVMEMRLVEEARAQLKSETAQGQKPRAIEQVHRKNVPNSSGMICSGRQTVLVTPLTPDDTEIVAAAVDALQKGRPCVLNLTSAVMSIAGELPARPSDSFEMRSDTEFEYRETLGARDRLYVIGGGHCSLALSAIMSGLNFRIEIFDDRPELNTIEKNHFANAITIVESYDNISRRVEPGEGSYVVVMTLGYAYDEIVIRSLIDTDLKYLGVLGSKAKMAALLKELRDEGHSPERLERIHTPIGLPINSHTPEEIAVSIAAEIISVRNG